ncbi:MAG: L-lactate dehydrogenase complex protein LldF [Solirubrobacteraceae bacterium]|nr:L-lactate dehydrogenase complex protein LldF [Solirubrobacteraceae bacterium]
MSRIVHPASRSPNASTLEVLHYASGNWGAARASAKEDYDWPAMRERAKAIRTDAVANLPELLEEFESQVVAAGGVVHHAATGDEARSLVVRLCAERGLRRAIKAKSMLSEEISLNEGLLAAGIDVVETDLGEWILQLLGQRPSHILAPSVHVSADEVAELFSERSGKTYRSSDTSEMVGYAREALREAFLAGDVGITGANMAVASTGTLIIVESEGNIRLCSGLPRVHIALMGIEKVLRDWDGAGHLLQMLPLAALGKPAATYSSLITGVGDDDGPDELHVVLVDDGRSALRGTDLESALHCIRCGACLYACPVYRQVGGHAYGAAYSGPIGAVITPALEASAPPSDELPWLSSLCGACTEACPVGIPLDEHLITLRAQARHGGTERAFWEVWARLWSRPSTYRATAATAGRALKPMWRAAGGTDWVSRSPLAWTDGRDAKVPAAEPFHVRWKRQRG